MNEQKTNMDTLFISQFSWGVGKAFASALGQCRFEEGDVLYSNNPKEMFQVLDPSRNSRSDGSDGGSVFERNWSSEVKLQRYTDFQPKGEVIVTTQGRLYTLLWKGNEEQLYVDGPECPIPNVNVSKATRLLEQTEAKATLLGKGNPVFVMAYDRGVKASNAKFVDVKLVLQRGMKSGPVILLPKAAGITEWDDFIPTITVAFFVVDGMSRKKMLESIKRVTYKPSKKAKKDSYKIERHGRVF